MFITITTKHFVMVQHEKETMLLFVSTINILIDKVNNYY